MAQVPSTSTTASSTTRTPGGRTTRSSPSTTSKAGSPSATTRARTASRSCRSAIDASRSSTPALASTVGEELFLTDEVQRPQLADAARPGHRGAPDPGRGRVGRERSRRVPVESGRRSRSRAQVHGRRRAGRPAIGSPTGTHVDRRPGIGERPADLLFHGAGARHVRHAATDSGACVA